MRFRIPPGKNPLLMLALIGPTHWANNSKNKAPKPKHRNPLDERKTEVDSLNKKMVFKPKPPFTNQPSFNSVVTKKWCTDPLNLFSVEEPTSNRTYEYGEIAPEESKPLNAWGISNLVCIHLKSDPLSFFQNLCTKELYSKLHPLENRPLQLGFTSIPPLEKQKGPVVTFHMTKKNNTQSNGSPMPSPLHKMLQNHPSQIETALKEKKPVVSRLEPKMQEKRHSVSALVPVHGDLSRKSSSQVGLVITGLNAKNKPYQLKLLFEDREVLNNYILTMTALMQWAQKSSTSKLKRSLENQPPQIEFTSPSLFPMQPFTQNSNQRPNVEENKMIMPILPGPSYNPQNHRAPQRNFPKAPKETLNSLNSNHQIEPVIEPSSNNRMKDSSQIGVVNLILGQKLREHLYQMLQNHPSQIECIPNSALQVQTRPGVNINAKAQGKRNRVRSLIPVRGDLSPQSPKELSFLSVELLKKPNEIGLVIKGFNARRKPFQLQLLFENQDLFSGFILNMATLMRLTTKTSSILMSQSSKFQLQINSDYAKKLALLPELSKIAQVLQINGQVPGPERSPNGENHRDSLILISKSSSELFSNGVKKSNTVLDKKPNIIPGSMSQTLKSNNTSNKPKFTPEDFPPLPSKNSNKKLRTLVSITEIPKVKKENNIDPNPSQVDSMKNLQTKATGTSKFFKNHSEKNKACLVQGSKKNKVPQSSLKKSLKVIPERKTPQHLVPQTSHHSRTNSKTEFSAVLELSKEFIEQPKRDLVNSSNSSIKRKNAADEAIKNFQKRYADNIKFLEKETCQKKKYSALLHLLHNFSSEAQVSEELRKKIKILITLLHRMNNPLSKNKVLQKTLQLLLEPNEERVAQYKALGDQILKEQPNSKIAQAVCAAMMALSTIILALGIIICAGILVAAPVVGIPVVISSTVLLTSESLGLFGIRNKTTGNEKYAKDLNNTIDAVSKLIVPLG